MNDDKKGCWKKSFGFSFENKSTIENTPRFFQ